MTASAQLFGGTAFAQTRTPTSPLDQPSLEESHVGEATIAGTPSDSVRLPGNVVRSPANLPSLGSHVADRSYEALIPDLGTTAAGLTPRQAVQQALTESLSARAVRAQTRAAGAARTEARLSFLPRTQIAFRYTRLSDYAPGRITTFDTPGCLADLTACQTDPASFQSSVVLQEPILDQYALRGGVSSRISDLVGATRHNLRAATADLRAARAQEEASEHQLSLQTLNAYWQLVQARAQLDLAREAERASERRAEDAEARLRAGVITEVEHLQAESQRQSYRQLVQVANLRAQVAEAMLADLLQLQNASSIPLSASLLPLPAPPRQGGEMHSAPTPAVVAAEAQAQAADARADAQRAAQMPTLDVAFSGQYANPNSRIFPQETVFTGTWDVSVELGWSLDGALLSGARRRRMQAQAEAAHLTALDREQAAEREQLQARGDFLSSLLAAETARLEASAAAEQDEASEVGVRAGTATVADRLTAASQFLAKRLDLVEALVAVHLAQARFRIAMGQSPLTQQSLGSEG